MDALKVLWAGVRLTVFQLHAIFFKQKFWNQETFYDKDGQVMYIGAALIPSGAKWPHDERIIRKPFYCKEILQQ